MRARRRAVACAVFVLAVAGGDPGGAASAVESGWWTSAPVAAAPDVSDDQLLLQGGPDPAQPLAYAGISFTLAADEAPESLVLTVAPGSGSTPSAPISVCRLAAPATPAAGDPAAEGPPIDCSTQVEAPPAGDGSTYEVDVTSFVATGSLDLAVLATRATDRVVLEKPVVDALRSSSGGSGGSSGVTVSGSDTAGSSSGTSSSTDSTSTGSAGSIGSSDGFSGSATPSAPSAAGSSFDVTSAPTPTPAASAPSTGSSTAASATGGATPSNASTAAAPQRSGDGGSSGSRAPFVFGGLALAAAALWALAGQQDPQLALDAGEQP